MVATMDYLGIQYLQETLLLLLIWVHNTHSQVYSSYDYKDKDKAPHKPSGEPDNYQYYPGNGYDRYNNYDNYDSNNYYGGISFYDDTLEEYNDAKPKTMECYTCHFSKYKYEEQGMPNCDEPFQDEGIPTITCEGLCAKTRTIIGEGEYMLIRSCLPNCKDIRDPISHVECCYGERCNGAVAGAAGLMASLSVCGTGVILTVLLQTVL